MKRPNPDELSLYRFWGIGGAEGNRTPDLVIANDALSQLSYGPVASGGMGYPPTRGRK